MRHNLVILGILATALTACGGGGGGVTPPTGGGGGSTPTPTPTSTSTSSASTTNASGTVVADDSNGSAAGGAPLAGVSVKLMPWSPCAATPSPSTSITPENDGCPTPLPSPQATTAANGTFTLNGVPNGHYVLVIGSDGVSTPPPGYTLPGCTVNCGTPTPAPFTVQATVHDNVTLTGGNQMLKAPTLTAMPGGYTPPTWETNGDYRLATLNTTLEMPCYIGWEYERSQNGLAGSSVDEWSTENVRAIYAFATSTANTGQTVNTLTTGNEFDSGGTDCANSLIVPAFPNTYSTNPRTIWFGGTWGLFEKSGTSFYQGFGQAEFPIDPRSFVDPNYPNWP